MKKILITFLLITAMVASMLPVHAAEAEITVEVRASKTNVQVGDIVEYTVLATGYGVVAMQFEVRFPEGLRYVPNSGATPDNLAQKLGVPAADWTEISKMFTFYNDIGITFAKGTEILRFSCVAEKAGDWDIILFELLPFNSEFLEFPPSLKVQTVTVIGESGTTDQPPAGETVPAVTRPAATAPTVVQKPTEEATKPTNTSPDPTEAVTEPVTSQKPTEEPTVDAIVTEPADQTGSSEVPTSEPLQETEKSTVPVKPQEPEKQPEKKGRSWLIPVIAIPVTAVAVIAVLLIWKRKHNK